MITLMKYGYVVLSFSALAFLSVLAFWHPEGKLHGGLFVLAGAMSFVMGLYMYDMAGNALGMTLALIFAGYWLICWGYAYKLIFNSGGDEPPEG